MEKQNEKKDPEEIPEHCCTNHAPYEDGPCSICGAHAQTEKKSDDDEKRGQNNILTKTGMFPS